jgi:hypothetical protein
MDSYELQDYTEMFNHLIETKGNNIQVLISKVNNINIEESEFRCVHRDEDKYVRFTITSKWKSRIVLCAEARSPQELMELFDKLKDIEFCKIKNVFLHKETIEKNKLYKFKNFVITHKNFKSDIEECSVCLDNTTNKICCGHSLCFVCESQMTEKKCPLCRNYFYCCEEDE